MGRDGTLESSIGVHTPEAGDECAFCPRLRFRRYQEYGFPSERAVIWSDDDFFLVPDISLLVEGHLLLVTQRHFPCYGACPERVLTALQAARERVRSLLKRAYGRGLVFFEHGSARHKEAGSCIDHAHLHVLPGEWSLTEAIEARLGPPRSADLGLSRTWYREKKSYLYLEENGKDWTWIVEALPCQFLREVVASLTGQREWWWQAGLESQENHANFCATLSRLGPLAVEELSE